MRQKTVSVLDNYLTDQEISSFDPEGSSQPPKEPELGHI
jgi:hypothetical protein